VVEERKPKSCKYRYLTKTRLMLTVTEVLERQETLAPHTVETLVLVNKSELSRLAKGVVPYYYRLSKRELIDELLRFSEDKRQQLKAEQESKLLDAELKAAKKADLEYLENFDTLPSPSIDLSVRHETSGLARKLFNNLVELLGVDDYVAQANREATALWGHETTRGFSENTLLRRKAEVNSYLLTFFNQDAASFDASNRVKLWVMVDSVRKHLNSLCRTLQEAKTERYRQAVVQRNHQRNLVDATSIFKRASDVLKSYRSHKLHDIGLALLLVTGRRLSEIYATARFELTDDTRWVEYLSLENVKAVNFSGRLKEKNREDAGQSIVIPVLIEPELLLEVMEYLQPYRRGTPQQAERSYSSSLSKRINHWDTSLKTHDLRRLYAAFLACSIDNYSKASFTTIYREALGHSADGHDMESYMNISLTEDCYQNVKKLLGY